MKFMDAHVHLKDRNDEVLDVDALLQEMDASDIERVFLIGAVIFDAGRSPPQRE